MMRIMIKEKNLQRTAKSGGKNKRTFFGEESMKKIEKSKLGLLFVLAFLLLAWQPAAAEKQNLIDEYGVFSDEEAAEINAKLAEFSTEKQIDYLIIFSNPFSDPTESTYARVIENFYDNNDYGLGEDRVGTVLLVDMENRKITVRGFGDKMYPVFDSDANIDRVTEKVGEKLKEEDFAGAVDVFMAESYRLYRRYNRNFLEKVVDMLFSFKGLGVALVGAALITLGVRAGHNQNGRPQASEFEVGGSFRLNGRTDTFSHKNVTSRQIERKSSGGSSSGGSGSTSRSSGGTRSF